MLGRISGYASRAASPLGAHVDTKSVLAAGLRPRSITTLTSLDSLPARLLRVPVFPVGRQGLARLGVPAHALLADAASFRDGVARLNRLIGSHPHGVAGPGLTPQEILGVALGVVQAAHRVHEPTGTPQVLSLVYHLLSSLPMDSRLVDAFEQHARRVVEDVTLDWMAKAASSDWFRRTSTERERALEEVVARMPVLPSAARVAAGADSRMRLSLEPIHPLAAALTPREDLDAGVLALSQELVFGEPSPQLELALATVPALIAHELLHIEQYGALGLMGHSAPEQAGELATAIGYGLSIGVQEDLWRLDSTTQLTPFLPHEQEAWALASLVLRAMIRHPQVPAEVGQRLKERLVDTYPRYAQLLGERFAPWAGAADGVLWAGGQADLQLRDMPQDEIRERVEAFIAQPPQQGGGTDGTEPLKSTASSRSAAASGPPGRQA